MAGPYTYNDTPQAGNPANQTQPLIRQNFSSINSLIGIDHVSFGTGSTDGYHRGIHIVDGAITPSLQAGECGLYVSSNDLYVQKGTGTAVNLTSYTDGTRSAGSGTVYTRTFTMPNGIVVKSGYTSAASFSTDTQYTILYPSAFSSTTHTLVASVFYNNSGTEFGPVLRIMSYTNTGFTFIATKGNTLATTYNVTFIAYGL